MATEPARFRPKQFPPPEFPPRRPAKFAKMPPAVFPAILGAIGLILALRRGFALLELPQGPVDLLAGLVLALWVFAVFSYMAKMLRRPGVLWDDLKVLPGRVGLAAATAGGLGLAALLVPYAPGVALWVLYAGLALHGLMALAIARALMRLPPEGRGLNPSWHLTFAGFIIGGLSAAPLGQEALARGLIWATLPVAAIIWGGSLVQLIRRIPPAPLRPLMAIHIAPAALFSTVATMTGQGTLAMVFATTALVIFLALLWVGAWVADSGFSALWGAFTFPLASLAGALLAADTLFVWAGLGCLAVALGFIPWVLWRVVKLWVSGQLAAKTNAAEA